MTERKLKYIVGLFLIACHFVLLCFVIALYFGGGFNIEEFTTVVAIITPVFAGYTTSIITFIVKDAKVLEDKTDRVSLVYTSMALTMPLLLVVILGLSVGLKAYNKVFANFEDFKRFLLSIESLFAVYSSMFVYSLFEKAASAVAAQRDEPLTGQADADRGRSME
jgi:hypothetical protein